MSCLTKDFEVLEGSSVVLLARVTTNEDVNITQADISSISFSSTLDGVVISGPTALVVADVVFDTLQKGFGWNADSIGFNMRYEPSVSAYPDGDQTYNLIVTITPVSGQSIVLLWSASVLETGL